MKFAISRKSSGQHEIAFKFFESPTPDGKILFQAAIDPGIALEFDHARFCFEKSEICSL